MLRVVEYFGRSDTGRQRRGNEDAYFARPPLFAVADGMGGAQAGEVAARLAVDVLEQGLPTGDESVEARLRVRVQEANERINALSRSDDERAGMGTTLTVAYVGEDELSVAHVGDSRLYRLRGDAFERLTEDHSLVEELVRQGRLTPEEADEHPQRSIITRALGPEAGVDADSRTWPARDGDVYLICSDGLTSMVPEAEVAEIVRDHSALAGAGRALIEAANAAGGRDNITVVLFRLGDVAADGAHPPDAGTTAELAAAAPTEEGAAGPASDPAPTAAVPRVPRTPPAAKRGRRRRRLRVPAGIVAGLVIVGVVLLGGYYASQSVYFVGASDDGFVTVFRGMPYDLPAGLDLYRVNYESGVPVTELSAAQRKVVTGHKLRSRDDALSWVRQLETGELATR
jgi:serine/threonine protein phosphatase PrpC